MITVPIAADCRRKRGQETCLCWDASPCWVAMSLCTVAVGVSISISMCEGKSPGRRCVKSHGLNTRCNSTFSPSANSSNVRILPGLSAAGCCCCVCGGVVYLQSITSGLSMVMVMMITVGKWNVYSNLLRYMSNDNLIDEYFQKRNKGYK